MRAGMNPDDLYRRPFRGLAPGTKDPHRVSIGDGRTGLDPVDMGWISDSEKDKRMRGIQMKSAPGRKLIVLSREAA